LNTNQALTRVIFTVKVVVAAAFKIDFSGQNRQIYKPAAAAAAYEA
jgi:hypothetical protein